LQRVRHAIATGEFQVDARAVAGRLIARFLVS
jgi:anti-sigma28 factor (negative regulator of flagellin synthesis)